MLVSHRPASQNAESNCDLLDDLARRVAWLCKYCPEQMRGRAAHEELVVLRPRVREAIEALDLIKERRPLSEDEREYRRAFKVLQEAEPQAFSRTTS